MLSLWLGLTDIYNFFHNSDLDAALTKHYAAREKKDPQGLKIPVEHRAHALAFTYEEARAHILELRRLHVALDTAVRDAYGWHDLVLGHDFHEVDILPEKDRVRYTISPTARRELLTRLLSENHARAAQEAAAGPPKAKSRKGPKKKSSEPAQAQSELVFQPEAIEKGKAILDVLALLYEAPDRAMGRGELEGALILMRFDDLRTRIMNQGVAGNAGGTTPNRPRVQQMDTFLASFNGTQIRLKTEFLEQIVELGPKAPALEELRRQSVGNEALGRAREALAALDRIRKTCASAEEQLDALGAEHAATFSIAG